MVGLRFFLSSSQVEMCDEGSDFECEEKIVFIITLEHDVGKTESLHLTLDTVLDTNGEDKSLSWAWEIWLTKSTAAWSYPRKYVQDVSHRGREVQKSEGDCNDKPPTHLSCGTVLDPDTGIRIDYSEGFCCVCDWGTRSIRGGVGCGWDDWLYIRRYEYSYCLRFDPPSWTVNELDTPFLDYSVEVGIAKPTSPQATSRDEAGYFTSFITLDSHTPTKTEGHILAHIVGDFQSGVAPWHFSGEYFVYPYDPEDDELVHPDDWFRNALFLEKHLFNLGGGECNFIGTSYKAFVHQGRKCADDADTCTRNQLADHYQDAVERGRDDRFASSRCPNYTHQSSRKHREGGNPFRCPINQRQTTMIRLETPSGEIQFVRYVATGTIEDVSIPSFHGFSGTRTIVIVRNSGRVTAAFLVGLGDCSEGIESEAANVLTLSPGETGTWSVRVWASFTESKTVQCSVLLWDAVGKLQDQRVVTFVVTEMMATIGTQGGLKAYELQGQLACGSICPGLLDVGCFINNSCYQQLGLATLTIFSLMACVVFMLGLLAYRIRRGRRR
eukprot:CAMPEP_0194495314 /NCGR_PEP_ID=MMETSP0253-20130528/12962_1 /TAXON_ID=2966 /ORGANISM="Noctiluca scintillans" /LENGTH=553 /DNA_ID=CAMNT_0039336561 /DNA_START=86 /DNA_END=1745 /DNA_ORIENTATION=-